MMEQGVIMGTAAYMPPEQIKGRTVDKRGDVWAFGCILYEMLTARPAFEGETITEILGGVLKSEPDWTALPEATPAAVRSVLRRCLRKDRDQRMHDIADARIEIEETLREPSAGTAAPVRRNRELWRVAAAVLVTMAATAGATLYFRPAPVPAAEMRLEITTPPTRVPQAVAISPDGQKIVFAANSEGRQKLFLRSLDSAVARPLAEAEEEYPPFWSPDSRSVGFFADGKLKRIDIDRGAVQTLANAPGSNRTGTWNRDGTIL